jgi:hypothetical protein
MRERWVNPGLATAFDHHWKNMEGRDENVVFNPPTLFYLYMNRKRRL